MYVGAAVYICPIADRLGVPKYIARPVCTALSWFVAIPVGKWLLGFKGSYPEYYREATR